MVWIAAGWEFRDKGHVKKGAQLELWKWYPTGYCSWPDKLHERSKPTWPHVKCFFMEGKVMLKYWNTSHIPCQEQKEDNSRHEENHSVFWWERHDPCFQRHSVHVLIANIFSSHRMALSHKNNSFHQKSYFLFISLDIHSYSGLSIDSTC